MAQLLINNITHNTKIKHFNEKISKTRNSGFTLIETMIACALGIMLCGVIIQNYLGNKNIYNLNTKIAHLNENLNFADFFLRQTVIHADFAGCRNISELKIHDHTNMHFDFTHPIKSYTANNSTVLVITKANAAIIGIKQDYKKYNYKNSIAVMQNPAIESNIFLLLSDCQNADLFTTDNYKKTRAVNLHNILSHDYSSKSTVISRFEKMTFFIAKTARLNTKNKPIYSLFFSINHKPKQELIPEIINMQINYEINNGTVQDLTTQQINNLNLWSQITAVKIILTPQEHLLGIKEWKIYIKLQQKTKAWY